MTAYEMRISDRSSDVCSSYLLGLRRNSARPWTEFDDAELVRRYGSDPTAAIASHLGRSCAAVYARAGFLDLTDVNPPDWTGWEDAQLVEGYRRGVPLRQLGKIGRAHV